eukprot:3760442-Rhodomonas_salina.1
MLRKGHGRRSGAHLEGDGLARERLYENLHKTSTSAIACSCAIYHGHRAETCGSACAASGLDSARAHLVKPKLQSWHQGGRNAAAALPQAGCS